VLKDAFLLKSVPVMVWGVGALVLLAGVVLGSVMGRLDRLSLDGNVVVMALARLSRGGFIIRS
jgi:hypothetical protein